MQSTRTGTHCIVYSFCLSLQGVQDQIDGLTASVDKALKKEMQKSAALCQGQFTELCSQLADRKAQIAAKTEQYQKVGACSNR